MERWVKGIGIKKKVKCIKKKKKVEREIREGREGRGSEVQQEKGKVRKKRCEVPAV